MELEIEKIKADIHEMAGNIPITIKLDKHLSISSSIHWSDKKIIVYLNPKKIRSQPKLDAQLEIIRTNLSFVS